MRPKRAHLVHTIEFCRCIAAALQTFHGTKKPFEEGRMEVSALFCYPFLGTNLNRLQGSLPPYFSDEDEPSNFKLRFLS